MQSCRSRRGVRTGTADGGGGGCVAVGPPAARLLARRGDRDPGVHVRGVRAPRSELSRGPLPRPSARQRGLAGRARGDHMSESQEQGLSALLNETRIFPPPEDLAKDANAQPGIYAEAQADPLGFWEAQAKRLTWAEPWSQVLEWRRPLRQVVRRRQAQRRRQLRRPPRRGGSGRPGRLLLGGRARRHPDHHLRRAAGIGLPGGQRPDRVGCEGGRQGGHLHADDPGGGDLHAGLRPPRRAPHRRLRWLLLRRPPEPHSRL